MSTKELSDNPFNTPNSPNDLFVVGIGSSTGGAKPLEEFFSHLPENSGAAFVVIQKVSPRMRGLMAELLQRQTSMPVYQVEDNMAIAPNTIYYLPLEKYSIVEDKKLRLFEPTPAQNDFAIDIFFSIFGKKICRPQYRRSPFRNRTRWKRRIASNW